MVQLSEIAPFRYSATDGEFPVTIEGDIPAALEGRLIRTAPAGLSLSDWRAEHWFDGLCLLYRFDIGRQANGLPASFRSRWLDSEYARQCRAGRVRMTSFGTRRNPGLIDWLAHPKPPVTDNCNVNILRHGDDYLALTETQHTLQFDPQSLAVSGAYRYSGDISRGVSNLAHPRYDARRGEIITLCTRQGPISEVMVTAMKPGSGRRTKLNSWTTRQLPYIHDFGLTEQYAIIIAHPFYANIKQLLWTRTGLAPAISRNPAEPTRLILLPLQGGEPLVLETEPGFVFHLFNSFEHRGEIIMDVIEHQGDDAIDKLSIDALSQQSSELGGKALRLRVDPIRNRVTREPLAEQTIEFPQINYRDAHRRNYRFGYAASIHSDRQAGELRYGSKLLKFDFTSGAQQSYGEADWLPGEPIFVPAGKPGREEDEGYLLSVASHRNREQSCCWILDARNMALLARLTVDTLVPLGFHGQFFRR